METKAGHQDKASLFSTVPLKVGRLESLIINTCIDEPQETIPGNVCVCCVGGGSSEGHVCPVSGDVCERNE